MEYEVLFYNGWVDPPAYYWIGTAEGQTPERALLDNLDRLVEEIKEGFGFDHDWNPEDKIEEAIYVLRPDGLVSLWDAKKSKRRTGKRSG